MFETAATEIASGAVPGEPAEPIAEVVAVVPRGDHRHDAGGGEVCEPPRSSASFAGSICGPPPEKLITSMPSFTAASKAATISGVFATCPIGVGTVKTR